MQQRAVPTQCRKKKIRALGITTKLIWRAFMIIVLKIFRTKKRATSINMSISHARSLFCYYFCILHFLFFMTCFRRKIHILKTSFGVETREKIEVFCCIFLIYTKDKIYEFSWKVGVLTVADGYDMSNTWQERYSTAGSFFICRDHWIDISLLKIPRG